MSYEVINGNALALPIEDETVDLIVTSPPYFALRSYRDEGEHYDGQVGSEATPQEFLEALWAATAEMVRVLKPSGSIWVNLGDKYAGSGGHNNAGISAKSTLRGNGHRGGVAKDGSANKVKATLRSAPDRYNQNSGGIPAKSLMGLPWRYAIGCIDRLGLILRAEVVWSKPNGLPESVTDRVRRSHEQWFHFTKSPRYFSAVDEVREAYDVPNHNAVGTRSRSERRIGAVESLGDNRDATRGGYDGIRTENPLGKLPGSVWTIKQEKGTQWIGAIGFCGSCGLVTIAGNGQDGATATVTAFTGSPTSGTGEPTDSSTNYSEAQSPRDSSSTTSAATEAALTLSTSSQSPQSSTSPEATPLPPSTQPRPIASTDTSSPRRTLISALGIDESAVCACETECEPDGLGSVWVVPSEPLIVPEHLGLPDHFAAFPQEWPRRIILGWSPSGICTACGEGRRPVVDVEYQPVANRNTNNRQDGLQATGHSGKARPGTPGSPHGDANRLTTITGYACACTPYTDHPPSARRVHAEDGVWSGDRENTPVSGGRFANHASRVEKAGGGRQYHLEDWTPPPTRPAVVLDPFGGTGTVAGVAHALGRHGISVDLSADYCRLAEWRISQSGHFQKAYERSAAEGAVVPLVAPKDTAAGRLSLFDEAS